MKARIKHFDEIQLIDGFNSIPFLPNYMNSDLVHDFEQESMLYGEEWYTTKLNREEYTYHLSWLEPVDEVQNVMNGRSADDGVKVDDEKLMWDLLPIEQVEDIVKVLTYGAKKYTKDNWMNVRPPERYYSALMRHLVAWKKGEEFDQESKLSHLSHAACCLLFLMWFDRKGIK